MRKDAAILAGTTLTGAILAFHFWSQLRDDRKLIAELRQQVGQLQTARSTDSASPAPAAVALQPEAPVSATVAPAPAAPAVPAAIPDLTRAPSLTLTSITNASNCEQLLAQMKRSTTAAAAELSAELRLAPAEAQRFAEIREAQTAIALPCSSGGAPAIGPEQAQAQLMALLGPGRFEQMQEYNARRSAQQNMATLSAQLNESGTPLTEEQARQLTATIMEENRRSRREATSAVAPTEAHARLAYEEEYLKLTDARFERTLKAAQTYLRPEQLAQLRGNMTRQANAMRDSVARMRTSVEEGRGIPPPQPVMIIRDASMAR